MADRRINFGESESDARYALEDDSGTGGDFRVLDVSGASPAELLRHDFGTSTFIFSQGIDLPDGTLPGADLVDGSVTSTQLGTDSVTDTELADASVDQAAIQTGAVSASELTDDSVTTAAIQTDAVTATELANDSVDTAAVQSAAITDSEIDLPSVVVENPLRPPIAELEDTESLEIPIYVPDTETLEVYRWGAWDASGAAATTSLDVELLDGSDTVQASANTANSQNKTTPVASHTNSSGSASTFKIRALNGTGSAINSPGVGLVAGFVVI